MFAQVPPRRNSIADMRIHITVRYRLYGIGSAFAHDSGRYLVPCLVSVRVRTILAPDPREENNIQIGRGWGKKKGPMVIGELAQKETTCV